MSASETEIPMRRLEGIRSKLLTHVSQKKSFNPIDKFKEKQMNAQKNKRKSYTPVYTTPNAGIRISAGNPALRAWMVQSIVAGEAAGKAPAGIVEAVGGTLSKWEDFGEIVLPVVLNLEKMASKNGHGGIDLHVVVVDGFVHVYHGETKLPLDFKVGTTPKQGLAQFAAAVAPLLNVKVGANGNGKTATDSPPKTASGMKVVDLKFTVDETMTLTGSAGCEGGTLWTIDRERDGQQIALGTGATAQFKFVCEYGVKYVMVFTGEGEKTAKRNFTPRDPSQDQPKTEVPAAATNETPAEPKVENMEASLVDGKTVKGSAFCLGAEGWVVTATSNTKKSLAKGVGPEAAFEFKGGAGEYRIVFKVGEIRPEATFTVAK